jgi:hypothetical protein
MSETPEGGKKKRDRSGLVVLIFLLLLLCLCAATPTLAQTDTPIARFAKPIADFLTPVLCDVPQLAAVPLFCPDGQVTEGTCSCDGTTLYCSIGDVSSSFENWPGCTGQADCNCEGTTLVCADGTKKENFPGCGNPGGGTCFASCNPNDPKACDEGLTCAMYGSATAGLYACLGDICKPPDTTQGDGSCWQQCNPDAPNCAEGLDCVLWGSGTSPYHVCFAENVCQVSTETPGDTCECKGTDFICTDAAGNVTSAQYNTTQCGGTGGCECRGPDLVCPDGSYGAFNPQCTGDGSTCQLSLRICISQGYNKFDAASCQCR